MEHSLANTAFRRVDGTYERAAQLSKGVELEGPGGGIARVKEVKKHKPGPEPIQLIHITTLQSTFSLTGLKERQILRCDVLYKEPAPAELLDQPPPKVERPVFIIVAT